MKQSPSVLRNRDQVNTVGAAVIANQEPEVMSCVTGSKDFMMQNHSVKKWESYFCNKHQ
jgi:hypothetical protein